MMSDIGRVRCCRMSERGRATAALPLSRRSERAAPSAALRPLRQRTARHNGCLAPPEPKLDWAMDVTTRQVAQLTRLVEEITRASGLQLSVPAHQFVRFVIAGRR